MGFKQNKMFISKSKKLSGKAMLAILFVLFIFVIGIAVGSTYSAFQSTSTSNGTLTFAVNGHQGTMNLSNTKVSGYNSQDLTLTFTLASETNYTTPSISGITMGGVALTESSGDFKTSTNVIVATYSAPTLMINRANVTGNLVITGSSTAQTYTITYNSNGGTGTMANSTPSYGSDFTLSTNTFTRTGYTFAGWAETSSGTIKYVNQAEVLNLGNKTLYAKWTANELTFSNQSKSKTFSTTSQNITFTGAGNGTGTYTYSILAGNYGNYFSASGTTIIAGASTPVGTYDLAITATDGGSSKTKTAVITITISVITMGTPSVSVSTAGVVTWGAITGATRYDISIDNSNWVQNVSSGYNFNSTITASTGSRTVYVRAIAGSGYDGNKTGSRSVNVYSVTLSSGMGISGVSGAGRYISGASVTINASLSTGYHWVNWTGSSTQTSQSYTFSISSNVSFTANGEINTYTVSVSILVDEEGFYLDIAYTIYATIYYKICDNQSDMTVNNHYQNSTNVNGLNENGGDYYINFNVTVTHGKYFVIYSSNGTDGTVSTTTHDITGASSGVMGSDSDGETYIYRQITSNCSISFRYLVDGG